MRSTPHSATGRTLRPVGAYGPGRMIDELPADESDTVQSFQESGTNRIAQRSAVAHIQDLV